MHVCTLHICVCYVYICNTWHVCILSQLFLHQCKVNIPFPYPPDHPVSLAGSVDPCSYLTSLTIWNPPSQKHIILQAPHVNRLFYFTLVKTNTQAPSPAPHWMHMSPQQKTTYHPQASLPKSISSVFELIGFLKYLVSIDRTEHFKVSPSISNRFCLLNHHEKVWTTEGSPT